MANRTLIVGSTGFIGRFLAEACLDSDHPTYLLVRSRFSASTAKAQAIQNLQKKGAIIITRFLPSEFGHDIDRAEPVEPGLKMYNEKRQVRRAIEEAGIDYTYVCCNSIAAWPYHDNTHPADVLPPLDHFHIYGDGNVKAYFVAGSDIGRLTIKVINDKRTVNKCVHFRPPNNLYSINELASLWEQKLERNLPRVTITEEDLLNAANEMRVPESIVAAFTHDIFIQGCQINFALDRPNDIEATSLYPDIQFRSIEECFDEFMSMIIEGHVMTGKATANDDIKRPRSESFAFTLSVA
ncbi:hypothetical protein KSS87_017975 [Heliosperma pusillum]|nr:hypothetical protein KSS87_017975 [Heliosperma pusillum]